METRREREFVYFFKFFKNTSNSKVFKKKKKNEERRQLVEEKEFLKMGVINKNPKPDLQSDFGDK
jgi:hypothetical protein